MSNQQDRCAEPTEGGHFQCRSHSLGALAGVILFALSSSTHAQLTIDVDTSQIPSGITSPMQIQINNAGSAIPVGSLDFYIEVASAGPDIVSVDLLGGTIF